MPCEVCNGQARVTLSGLHPLRACHFCAPTYAGRQPPGIPIRRCQLCNGTGYLTADGLAPAINLPSANTAALAEAIGAAVAASFQLPKTSQKSLPAANQATVQTTDAPPPFATISGDPELQQLLTNRWNECVGCLEHNLPLAATVMMGGLLEGLFLVRIESLVDKLPVFTASSAPKDRAGKTLDLKEWMLSNYIDVAHELAWISDTYRDVGEILRDYRNYIHPHKEHRHKKKISPTDSKVLWEISKHIAREVIKS